MAEDMQDSGLNFDLPKNAASVIKVIGVGGGGSNAVNHMKKMGINGVDFIVCNTDAQALDNSPVTNQIQLGKNLTEGLGAGANPEIGRQAAKESLEDIHGILEHNTRMLFITAGMGGGTGTGAAPVIAKLAKEMGILTVGIVTKPFKFEGNRRAEQAQKGIDAFRDHVDSLIVINNDKLREVYGNLGFRSGFAKADEVLATAAKGIAEVITYHYTANIDLRDVKTVLENSGTAIMGSGMAGGENRSSNAVMGALDSPLLNDNNIHGAKNVLLLIVSGTDDHEITMDEMGFINDHIQNEAGGNTNVIMGIGINEAMQEKVSVTIIATGFPSKQHSTLEGRTPTKVVHSLEPEQPVERSVHEKPLREIDSPDRPIKRKPEQPDLFSAMEQQRTVVHNLYAEEIEEETAPAVQEPVNEAATPNVTGATEEPVVETSVPEKTETPVLEVEPVLDIEEPIISESTTQEKAVAETFDMEPEVEIDATLEAEEDIQDIIPPIVIKNADAAVVENKEIENFAAESEMVADLEEDDQSDDMSFELDDIEGEGIALVNLEEAEEAEPTKSEEEYDPFDFTIDQVMGGHEKETDRISVDLDTELETEPADSPISANHAHNEPKRHTLEDLQELEEKLQIKKPVQEPSPQPVATTAPEEEDLLQFEIKQRVPEESREEAVSDTDFLNRPLSTASMKKIAERKKMLEQYSHQWRNDMTDILEKEPAYKRQGLDLGTNNYSSNASLGNMTVSGKGDETELKSNNSFLHDNVD